MKKLKTPELELLVAEYFGIRTNLIVPNLSWGIGLNYEADLTVITRSKCAYEIELKVSKSDLIAESKKKASAHKGKMFKRFYYAMPESIYDENLIKDSSTGVLLAYYDKGRTFRGRVIKGTWRIKEVKKAKNKKVTKLSDKKYLKILELSAMRVWSMKKKFVKLLKKV
jgi:hypothetical protein